MAELSAREKWFNRLFAVLLALFTLTLLLNIFTLPTVLLFMVFAFFLWFGKKYHLFVNIIFLLFALGVYFISIPPIAWGLFRSLKELRLSGFNFQLNQIFLIPLVIFVSLSVRNVIGNIFAYFTNSRKVFFISLFMVFVTVVSYPFLDKIRLRHRTENVNTAVGGDLSNVYTRQSPTFLDRYTMAGDFTADFDSLSKKYIYHLRLDEPLSKDIQFTKVEADDKKINFITDSWVKCLNCQKNILNPYGLIFPSGKNIDFII